MQRHRRYRFQSQSLMLLGTVGILNADLAYSKSCDAAPCWCHAAQITLCPAQQARAIMQRIGGNVAHVHLEPGARVSYGPYRDVSRTFVSLLRSFPAVSVVEKASIDEAYLLCMPGPGSSSPLPMDQAVRMAQAIKKSGMNKFCSLCSRSCTIVTDFSATQCRLKGAAQLQREAHCADVPDDAKYTRRPMMPW